MWVELTTDQHIFKMKITIVLTLVSLTLVAASPQFDFLSNLFGGGRNRNQRPRGGRQNGGGGGNCGGNYQPNHRFGGQDFLVSWRVGCSSFTQRDGENFCRANGMRPISIDSSAKEREFLKLIGQDRQRYFWTGGKIRGRTITWPSGSQYSNVNWSNTGGAKRPQPDNREGNEFCVAVLNNFYNDGIRFHDVSCHHKKPIICESS